MIDPAGSLYYVIMCTSINVLYSAARACPGSSQILHLQVPMDQGKHSLDMLEHLTRDRAFEKPGTSLAAELTTLE